MRRVAAVLLVVLLACPLLFTGLIVISLTTWTSDRSFYLGLLEDRRLFQVPAAVPSAPWSSTVIEGTGGLTWKSIGRAARLILTPQYLQSQARRVVNQGFDALEGRSSWRPVSIDTTPLKSALRGEAGPRFARLLAEDLPVGGSASDFRVGPGHLPVSRPAGMSVERAAALIQEGIPGFLRSIPDTVGLGGQVERETSFDAGVFPRISLLGGLVAADVLLAVLAGGFLAAAAFLGGRSVHERLQWCGWPILVAAAGVLLIGLGIVAGAGPWLVFGIREARLEQYGFATSFVAALTAVVRHVATRVGVAFLAVGGVTVGAALGLLAWAWTVPRTERGSGT